MNSTSSPLAHGNRFQRAYHRWAAPHYARMAPDLREQVEAIDRHLYTRQGLGTWLGVVGALVGTTLGLRASGFPWLGAVLLALTGWGVVLMMGLNLWLQPDKMAKSFGSLPKVALMLVLGLTGALFGTWVGHTAKRGYVDWSAYVATLQGKLTSFLPGLVVGMLGTFLVLWSLAAVRRGVLRRQRDQARLEAERDAATAEARQAQLRVLQAQIHPHFIFNTLAALQHWVDKGDERAAPLLREVTAFLRGATELLGRDSVTLADEWAQVGHYLAIMKARWGDRLRYEMDAAPALMERTLPPGVLLTLVENAVEHGIAHRLGGGALRVAAASHTQGWRVTVEDEGVGLAPGWQPGVGLNNVRQRLAHHAGPAATITLAPRPEGGCLATIEIPQ
ncbi:sensor histidine kinase [Inhella gelatinilytica]|uniref:Histidine kinase n=1 Tax=Inhella gelatinilytica TaxID=2795030 RepID=A0A931ISZ8_9BURK|nr:histidine kinase [Inhella gelatinilytica]MBH9551442.1 histidine kinase [Inhella gelatinilytica]